MDTKQLLKKARTARGLKSNYALAKRLGITQAALSNYELGIRHPKPYIAEKIAELAGMNPEAGVAICERDRAKNPTERKHWEMRICVKCPHKEKNYPRIKRANKPLVNRRTHRSNG